MDTLTIEKQGALFDYGALDQETQIAIRLRTSEIKSLAKRMAADVVEIGGKLAEVKDQLEGNGRFQSWLSAELGWSERTAYNFIAVWQKFSAADFRLENIATSALYLLAAPSTPAEAVESAKQIADEGGVVTNTVAKAIVTEAKQARRAKQPALVEAPELEETEEETATEGVITKTPEPVTVRVTQAELDEMGRLNSEAQIDQGEPVRLWRRGGDSFVITASPLSGARRVFKALGWLVKPERNAAGVRQRNHPADLVDEVEGYAESYVGVRVNVGSKSQPGWWVVVGPEYEFELATAPDKTPAPPPVPAKAKPGSSAKEIEAAWRKYGVMITIQLLPAKHAERQAMVTIRAGDLEPLSKVRKESEVIFVGAVLELIEQYKRDLPAKMAKSQAAKPAPKPSAKPAAKTAKPAPKAGAKQNPKTVKQKAAKAGK